MKQHLRALLADHQLDAVAAYARERTRTLGDLTALTYDPDAQVAWRAVEAMGIAAAHIAEDNPERVREQLRRLLWSLREEAGAICWRAPEAMAEIVSMCTPSFPEYVPIVVHLLVDTAEEDLAHFRAGMLWAIGRLGPLASNHLTDVLPVVTAALDHSEAQVRGMAVWALARVGQLAPLIQRKALLTDSGAVAFYADGTLVRRTVASLLPNPQ